MLDAEWTRKAKFAVRLLSLTIVALLFGIALRFGGCAVEEKPEPDQPVGPPAPTCEDGLAVGEVKAVACETGTGSRYYVCGKDGGLKLTEDGCAPPAQTPPAEGCEGVTPFTAVAPLLERCESCHDGYSAYAKAAEKADAFIARIKLPPGNGRHMPRPPKQDLTPEEVRTLERWRLSGLKESCESGTEPPRAPAGGNDLTLDQLETVILADLNRTPRAQDRANVLYLVATHKDDAARALQAASKGLNHLSTESRRTRAVELVPGLFKANLEDYDLDGGKIQLVEEKDPFDLESFTNKGELIKLLVGGGRPDGRRKPWMMLDAFLDTAMFQAPVYYALTETKGTFGEEVVASGVDFAKDLGVDFKALLSCFNGSPISSGGKNRMIIRHDGDEGAFWTTQDPVALGGDNTRNCFQNPFPAEVGSRKIFNFAASETIKLGKNGMLFFGLWNAAGIRQNEAPLDIVNQGSSRPYADPVIRAPISCYSCHSAGFLPARDQVLAQLVGNPTFNANDQARGKALYRAEDPFPADNAVYRAALEDIGVDPDAEDPINVGMVDDLRTDWGLAKLGRFLLFPDLEEFRARLGESAQGRAEASALLSGDKITHDQVVNLIPTLKADLRLLQEGLGN